MLTPNSNLKLPTITGPRATQLKENKGRGQRWSGLRVVKNLELAAVVGRLVMSDWKQNVFHKAGNDFHSVFCENTVARSSVA